ncbi:hypothetical protein N0V82_003903 [Gnomoniopsis sp. IMI 355080]|nr:hypothetical protein N0V82_003903 [Gnomoniopsis sp. IMI 355080]
MRFLQSHIVNISHGLPTASRAVAARPLQRSLHQSSVDLRPRQRSFFTSNLRLAKDGTSSEGHVIASSSNSSDAAKDSDTRADIHHPANRRRGKISAPKKQLRDPLRRVASIAQRAGRKPQQATKDGVSMPGKDYAQTICAICVAESFDMKEVVRALHGQHYLIDPDGLAFDDEEIIHARVRDTAEGDFFIFESGTVVTWSLPPEKGVYVATDLLHKAKKNPHDTEIETDNLTEKLEFEIDDSTPTSSMRGDTVVLGTRIDPALDSDPTDTGRAKIAFSSGLARSTKVAVLETLLNEFLERTMELPMQLEKGDLRVDMRHILKLTGTILRLRSQLNFFSELTDSLPDKFWDQRAELRLDSIYDQVGKALDVPSRIRVLNQRIDYADEMLATFRGMLQAKHDTRLEEIIIYLIAIEVVFQLINWWRDYKDKARADGEEPSLAGYCSYCMAWS